MKKRKKYLTIEEKRQLALEGKHVPVCAYPDERARKRKQRKLYNRFFKFLNT